MQRKGIIGLSVLVLGLATIAVLSFNRQPEDEAARFNSEKNVRQMQVQNLQQDNPRILKINAIRANDITKKSWITTLLLS